MPADRREPAAREERPPTTRSSRERARLAAAGILAAAVVAFAVMNLEEVSVDWGVGSAQTPLIVVIVLSFTLGALAGRLLAFRRRRRR
jgi:uncharacterized integral membrane protein